ncbi:MAG: type II toxin-antitoxin system VapC family toxin [Rhizobiaceae bacterium]|nr:type II toxin-antitoxin system VapC family toxin [Rhizobiaceae bacterium]
MPFVLDASMAATWMLPDENNAEADRLMEELHNRPALVPTLFWFETRNLFVMAERRQRLAAGAAALTMGQLRRLRIDDAGTADDNFVITMAIRHSLSGYDASYLALSVINGLPLATVDQRLATAAKKENIPVLGPLQEI